MPARHSRLAPLTALLFPALLAAQADAKPVFQDGMAQIVPAFADTSTWIRQELWVETSFDTDGDGRKDRMHVDVVRPGPTAAGLKVPVVYETSPYYAGTSGAREFLWNVKQEVDQPPPARTSQPDIPFRPERHVISNSEVRNWVPRGFAVVHSESPGTGLSQGCPTVGGPNEELAPKAVIEWLNGRAKGYTTIDGNEEVKATWSTGKVGMTGTSYNGTLPLAAATTGVDGLEAIIPVSPNTSYYHYYRSNGLVRHPGGWLGEDMDFLYDFINSGNPAHRAYCNAQVRDRELKGMNDRTTGDWNDFWAKRDYWQKLDGVKAATLLAHGFNDWNVMPEHSVHVAEVLEKRGVPVQVYFHQGGHGGPPPLDQMNKWFTRYLYGIKNGVENDPKAWIVREGDPRDKPTPYASYPLPGSAPVTLHPTGDGNGVGTLVTGSMANAGIGKLTDLVDSSSAALAKAPRSDNRLIYATPELSQPLHISGAPKVTIKVAVNKPAANLSVYLVELPYTEPTDRRQSNFSLVTRGWADLQNHASLEHGEPLEPGKFYEMTFELQPDDQIIPAGKRLGLMIFSSDKDFTLWPAPGTELQVELGATSITLPVVGGTKAYAGATTTP